MKTKTALFIVLGIVVLVLIGLLVFKKSDTVVTPAVDTGTSSATGATDTTATATSKTGTSPAIIHLTGGSHGTTTELVVGQKMIVTLTTPTDADYSFDPLQYDSSILSVVTAPSTTVTAGETATWEFVALKSGTTGLTITATQGTNKASTVTLFTGAFSVK